ncbi:unnamed protein product, partial [marine sediment metagenome]
MTRWTKIYEDLNKALHLRTYPLAVKYFPSLNERPKGIAKPKEPLNVCQIASLARYYGRSVYFTVENMACIVGAVCLGLYPMPEQVESGKIADFWHKDRDAAREFIQSVPKIEYGEVKAIVIAPLHQDRVTFEPDQFLIYANTAQTMRILQGHLWGRGGRVSFSTGGEYSLCADAMAQSYLTKDFSLTIPCFGDRQTAMAMDDELAVCIPASMIGRILEGMKNTQLVSPYPIPYGSINSTPTFMPKDFLTEYAS